MARYAAIDIGTNSVRMYVAEVEAGRTEHVDRDLVITRLGRGVDAGGALQPDAIARTVEAVGAYWDRCRALGVTGSCVRIAATSAVRDSANREEFLSEVRARTGLEAGVLTGEEEAALSFAGAVADLRNPPGTVCVLDIGGGSTELVIGEWEMEAAISLDIGSVRLTERFVRSDPPPPEQVRAVAEAADEALEEAARTVKPGRASTLVGVAGTITTLSAVAQGLPGYDRDAIHHSVLSLATVEGLLDRLASMTSAQRRELPAMPAGREDVIVAGTVILQRVMRRFGFDEVLVSEADILDGLLATMS